MVFDQEDPRYGNKLRRKGMNRILGGGDKIILERYFSWIIPVPEIGINHP